MVPRDLGRGWIGQPIEYFIRWWDFLYDTVVVDIWYYVCVEAIDVEYKEWILMY